MLEFTKMTSVMCSIYAGTENNMAALFRKRLIPDECIRLDNDTILYRSDNIIVTRWNTFRPKSAFSWGISCYVIDKGYKVSRFFKEDNSLAYIYCDIIDTIHSTGDDSYIFTDLLADVIIENNGMVRVVDIDELADAYDSSIISQELLSLALRRLDALLKIVYDGSISIYTDIIDRYI